MSDTVEVQTRPKEVIRNYSDWVHNYKCGTPIVCQKNLSWDCWNFLHVTFCKTFKTSVSELPALNR